jgi:predicted 2-oxoglutarate/Fe(II)-dependent dioxygenase YbiX
MLQQFHRESVRGFGDQMGRHVDNNMLCQSMQLVLVWGDFKGGDLVIYDKDGTRTHAVIGPAILLMDGNAQHEVTPVTCGTRYSIVTYAKHTFPKCTEHVREQIRQFGFPLPTLYIGSLRRARVGHA